MRKKSYPKSDAVSKVREVYRNLRDRPLSPTARKELEEVFKRREKTTAQPPKKIAKPDQDAGLT